MVEGTSQLRYVATVETESVHTGVKLDVVSFAVSVNFSGHLGRKSVNDGRADTVKTR